MYLVRTDFTVSPGGTTAFEERRATMADLSAGIAGYLGQTLLRSYRYPTKYTTTTRFDDVAAAWAYLKYPAIASFIGSGPAGLASVTHQEGYESVLDVNADNLQPTAAHCETLVDVTLRSPGVAAEFEQSRRELFELRKQHAPGFASHRLRRSAGDPMRYLNIQIWTDIDAARQMNAAPAVRAFFESHPNTRYTDAPLAIEAYAVLFRK